MNEFVEEKDRATIYPSEWLDQNGITRERFRKKIMDAISKLGFQSYDAKIIDVSYQKEVGRYLSAFWGKTKYKYEKASGFTLYVEVRW